MSNGVGCGRGGPRKLKDSVCKGGVGARFGLVFLNVRRGGSSTENRGGGEEDRRVRGIF